MLQAKQFGTTILDEDGLLNLLKTLPGKKSKYVIAAENEVLQVIIFISIHCNFQYVVLFILRFCSNY